MNQTLDRVWLTRASTRLAVVLTAWVMLFSLVMPSALAFSVTDSGTKYCDPSQYVPATRAYSTAKTEHFPPGSGYDVFYNGSSWKVTRAIANQGDDGGFWLVEVTGGSLSDLETYGYCSWAQ